MQKKILIIIVALLLVSSVSAKEIIGTIGNPSVANNILNDIKQSFSLPNKYLKQYNESLRFEHPTRNNIFIDTYTDLQYNGVKYPIVDYVSNNYSEYTISKSEIIYLRNWHEPLEPTGNQGEVE